jgi:hypothetical protein
MRPLSLRATAEARATDLEKDIWWSAVKKVSSIAVAACLVFGLAWISSRANADSGKLSDSKNVVESSVDFNSYLNSAPKIKEKPFRLMGDDTTSVGFDNDGNPSVNTQF